MDSKKTTLTDLHWLPKIWTTYRNIPGTILIITGITFYSVALADIYKYTDDSGSVCITNTLQNVPKKFRSSMSVVKEDAPVQKKLLPEVQKRTTDPVPSVQPAIHQKEQQNHAVPVPPDNRQKYINTALVIAGLVAVYFVLGKIFEYIGFQKVGIALFLLTVLLGGVYLYGLYIQEMSAIFGALRKDAHGIKKNVETRDLKTDQMLKQLDEKELAQDGKEVKDQHVIDH